MSRIVGNPRYPTLEEILGAIADWINRYREAYAAHGELVNCGADEIARIAQDLGISSNELATLATKDANSR